ncbi:MAG TPA: 2-oxo acid dehydrogenase subunit E2, partial [Chthonomonadaceae bacterium]|nr:2-oxo acid dehydrogenase subunit E2 [Chthonomonadaceae bacterium]
SAAPAGEEASRQVKGGKTGRTVAISPRARRAADENGVPVSALAGLGTGPGGRVIERDVLAWLESQKGAPETPVRATPLAARMAGELGIDLNDLATGLPGSRVRREDVLRYADVRRPALEPAASDAGNDVRVLAFGGLRKRIAENVSRSAFTAPHVTLALEVDMTAAAALRARLLAEIEKVYGARLTYTDLLVKAAARALEEHPRLNAALVGEEIRLYAHKNIGVAVALEEGLIVPVVRRVETKSLGAVSAELSALVARARAGSVTPDDLADGTFTLTNLGAFGIELFDPIILPPQAAILGVGRIAEKPVVIDGQITIRSMMNLCLSFDHRVLDGAPAARFLQRLKELLENPEAILI